MAALRRENLVLVAWALGVLAAIALIAAQFMDYTAISIGAAGAESAREVAPAPLIDAISLGSDQLWIGLPLGGLALLVLATARRGQWRMGRSLVAIGMLLFVLTLAVHLPNGLEERGAELAYDDAAAVLRAGFWVQLIAAGVLAVAGGAMARLGARTAGPQSSRRRRPRRAEVAA